LKDKEINLFFVLFFCIEKTGKLITDRNRDWLYSGK